MGRTQAMYLLLWEIIDSSGKTMGMREIISAVHILKCTIASDKACNCVLVCMVSFL